MDWTAEKVRAELPDVKVRTTRKGQPVTAVVRGRFNSFATVGIVETAIAAEFTWDAVAASLNSGKPLEMR